MNNKKEIIAARNIMSDMEMEQGIFVLGARYFIRTPVFHYIGTLKAVTGTVFVFENTKTVFDSGPFEQFFKGKEHQSQRIAAHEGADELVVDRGGVILNRFDNEKAFT